MSLEMIPGADEDPLGIANMFDETAAAQQSSYRLKLAKEWFQVAIKHAVDLAVLTELVASYMDNAVPLILPSFCEKVSSIANITEADLMLLEAVFDRVPAMR